MHEDLECHLLKAAEVASLKSDAGSTFLELSERLEK